MKAHSTTAIKLALSAALLGTLISSAHGEDSLSKVVKEGITTVDLRLRYENVEQDSNDANALTLRTLLAYTTAKYQGFSGKIEVEDTRIVLGLGEYTVGPTGYHPGQYSVIADPEHTELDQGFLQYDSGHFSAKIGRQVLALDNHRFVGHVGWRQDRQTFDGVSAKFSPTQALTLNYAYLTQRNRIFAQAADLDSKDHLINLKYLMSWGTLTGYGYLLEIDNHTVNSLDTFGLSFNGSTMAGTNKIFYGAEFASQNSKTLSTDFSANYLMLEAGAVINGVTGKLAYESLGSDHGEYGFSTPLATLHKFNGWADMFLNTPVQGLVDVSLTLLGKAAGGGWMVVYHDFSADKTSETIDSLGSEIDLSYEYKYADNYSLGIKYAAYSSGSALQDTDKLWVWVGASL